MSDQAQDPGIDFLDLLAKNSPSVGQPPSRAQDATKAQFPYPQGVGQYLTSPFYVLDVASPTDLNARYPNGIVPVPAGAAAAVIEPIGGQGGYLIQWQPNGPSLAVQEGDIIPAVQKLVITAPAGASGALKISFWDFPSALIRAQNAKLQASINALGGVAANKWTLISTGTGALTVPATLMNPTDLTAYRNIYAIIVASGATISAAGHIDFSLDDYDPLLVTDLNPAGAGLGRSDYVTTGPMGGGGGPGFTGTFVAARGPMFTDLNVQTPTTGGTSRGSSSLPIPYGALKYWPTNVTLISYTWYVYGRA